MDVSILKDFYGKIESLTLAEIEDMICGPCHTPKDDVKPGDAITGTMPDENGNKIEITGTVYEIL